MDNQILVSPEFYSFTYFKGDEIQHIRSKYNNNEMPCL